MKIKKLIVRKTKPSEEVIREIQFKEKASNAMVDYVKSYIEKSIPLRGIVKNRSIEQALPDICELHKHIFGKELIDTTKDR